MLGIKELIYGVAGVLILFWIIKKYGRKSVVDGAKETLGLKNDLKKLWAGEKIEEKKEELKKPEPNKIINTEVRT